MMKFNLKKVVVSTALILVETSVCLFLAGRLKAFLWSAYTRAVPILPVFLFLAAVSILLTLKKHDPVRQLAGIYLKTPRTFIIAVLSAAFCRMADGIVLKNPLEGTGLVLNKVLYWISLLGATALLAVFLFGLTGALKREVPRLRAFIKALCLKDIIFCVCMLIAFNVCAWLYIRSSHTIYFWDTAGYWTGSHVLAETARREGLVPLLKTVFMSIQTQDYNDVILLPWVPLVLLFGTSRWVFVAGIVNLGMFPILLLLYAYIKTCCRRPVFITVCVAACFPMLFYTALVGFIDVAGVGVTFLALILWLRARKENENGRYLLIGCLLALAILLRRWYAFYALSFFIALTVDALLKKRIVPLLIAGLSFAFSLLFLFQPFVTGRLLKNYSALYSAYRSGFGVDLHYFFYYFGIFVVFLSLAGAFFLIKKQGTRRQGIFLLLQPVVCFLLFTQVQTHGQQHLLLYVPSFLCLVSVLFETLASRIDRNRAFASLMAVCAFLPLASPVWQQFLPDSASKLTSYEALPAFNYVPPSRADADTFVALIRYLDDNVGRRGKSIGVLASSFSLNKDMLLNTEASLGLSETSDVDRSYLAWLPEVDGRDLFPGNLPYCDYYLVADPVQVHMGIDKQECVALPARQILDGTGIGAAVHPVGDTFFIGYGNKVKVRLYEKYRPFTDAETQSLVNEYHTLTGR